MRFRLAALLTALLFTAGCPSNNGGPDGGEPDPDSGVVGTCTGGCGPTQVCNATTRQCEDACGGCDGGTCVKIADNDFRCQAAVTLCGGKTCGPGQNACVNNVCSCSPGSRGAADSCAAEGKVCRSSYNLATNSGGTCEQPRRYEACKATNCPSGRCGVCPTGLNCQNVFSGFDTICLKPCSTNTDCLNGELCGSFQEFPFCLPASIFWPIPCERDLPDGGRLEDGGRKFEEVGTASSCLVLNSDGVPSEASPTGNCTLEFLRGSERTIPLPSCRAPGAVVDGAACKRDFTAASADQCGTGLECFEQEPGVGGKCHPLCNAALVPGGVAVEPACGSGKACANIHYQESRSSAPGVCLDRCNVYGFNTLPSSCGSGAACVPVDPAGTRWPTPDGTGLCISHRADVRTVGQPCSTSEPFKGAACQNGQLCAAVGSPVPTCQQLCDVTCHPTDGGTVPGRCAAQPSGRCPSGKSCSRATSTTGAVIGFCL
jgi:hypothetical protein